MNSIYDSLQRSLRVPSFSSVDYDAADREISKNRLFFALAFLLYLVWLHVTNRVDQPVTWITSAIYLGLAIALATKKLRSSKLLTIRRYLALGVDVTALSIGFATAGIYAAPAFLLYLWLVVGYGFRYGILLLRLASGLSLAGFGMAAFVSPYWSQQPYIITSFLATLLVIPAYIELLLRKLLKANEQLQDANHAKALMLARASQGLRGPLGYINASAARLLRTKLELFQMDLIASIQVSIKSLLSELDDFVDVSRIEAGRTAARPETFATAQAIREAMQMVAADAQEKKLRMSWHIAFGVPSELHTDRAYFIKVLTNLLNNAVKFTGAGFVTVYLRPAVDADKKSALRVEVEDTGIGIKRDVKEKIWESYTQANSQILYSYGGAGLGLSIVRQLVDLMGGTVGASSKVKSGSTFWFQIPALLCSNINPGLGWPSGLAVVLISSRTEQVSALLRNLRILGGQVFLVDQARYVLSAVAGATDEVERFVIMIDGQDGNPVNVAYSLRFDAALSRVPLILLSDPDTKTSSSARQVFATAVPACAAKGDLIAALRIADNHEDVQMPTIQNSAVDLSSEKPQELQLRVLLAERTSSNRLVLKKQIEATGHACWAVEDGERVIESFAEAEFDVVLVDTEIPKMNGFDTSQMLRFISAATQGLPIVGIADNITPGLKQRSIDAGMNALLTRPVTTAQIAALLEDCLSASRPHAAGQETKQDSVEPLYSHPKFRAGKGPPLSCATLSHLGLKMEAGLLDEVRQAFQVDTHVSVSKLREAVSERDAEKFRDQLQATRSLAATLGAAHLEHLCKEGGDYLLPALELQGRILLQKIEAEVQRVDEQLGELE